MPRFFRLWAMAYRRNDGAIECPPAMMSSGVRIPGLKNSRFRYARYSSRERGVVGTLTAIVDRGVDDVHTAGYRCRDRLGVQRVVFIGAFAEISPHTNRGDDSCRYASIEIGRVTACESLGVGGGCARRPLAGARLAGASNGRSVTIRLSLLHFARTLCALPKRSKSSASAVLSQYVSGDGPHSSLSSVGLISLVSVV